MRVVVCGPNLSDQSAGTFHVHALGCGHIGRRVYWRADRHEMEVTTVYELVCDVYPPGEFDWDGSATDWPTYRDEFKVFACVELPEGEPQQ